MPTLTLWIVILRPPCFFIYVTAVLLSEKVLTWFLLESFRKAFSANSIASNSKTFMW